MTEITITVDGEAKREYSFKTLEEEDADRIVTFLLMETDGIIATLDSIGSISATDPPELDEE